MKDKARNISLWVNKQEFALLDEACLFGADADENLDNPEKEKGGYRIYFTSEELDDLAGFVAAGANHETSRRNQERWDKLYAKIESLLKFNDSANYPPCHQIQQVQQCALRYFIFDIWIESGKGYKAPPTVLRRIQIAETKSLYNFAKVITHAFGFYFDHCFGFYDNFKRYHDSKKAYEVFVDIGEDPLSPHTKGVKKTKIKQAFAHPGDTMLFFYDYGDCWRFAVELKEIRQAEKWDLKPVTLESIGKAPPQYPPCEEDEHGKF